MKRTVHYLLCTLIVTLSAASAGAYGASPRGTIEFIASQEGVALQGAFNEFAANVKFDPSHPEAGAVKVRVDVRSVATGDTDADELLRSKDFFDAAKFPQATFEASGFHAQDAGRYVAKGTFSLKGHTVPLAVTFSTTANAQGRWFDGSFTISRLAFHVGQGEWADTSTLADAVRIKFHVLQAGASP